MASNLDTLVTVFGGSGFVGRSVVRALARRDYRIRVAVRRPELAFHLQPLGRVGQIHAVQANLRYPASVEAAMRDSHVAINLVGILAETGAQKFDAVQGAGAAAVARTAAAAGARMVHVSAIGADADPAWFPSDGLVHRDLHTDNVLVGDDGTLTGIIAFSSSPSVATPRPRRCLPSAPATTDSTTSLTVPPSSSLIALTSARLARTHVKRRCGPIEWL